MSTSIPLPHTIENHMGEKLIFKAIEVEDGVEKVLVENFVQPGAGPIMHTHFKQDESLTVVSGRLGVEVQGEAPQYYEEGDTATFLAGTPHRFWNAGDTVLNCVGYVKPANSIVFYLSALYDAINKSGKEQPAPFEGAYLMTRYKSEYDVPEIPGFVKSVIMPITVFLGKMLGKYKQFKNAPEPL